MRRSRAGRPFGRMLETWLPWTGVTIGILLVIGGVIWVLSLFYTPYVYLFVIAPMRQMDAGARGRRAGARRRRSGTTLRHITMPLLMPALLSARAGRVRHQRRACSTCRWRWPRPQGIRTMPTEIFQLGAVPVGFRPRRVVRRRGDGGRPCWSRCCSAAIIGKRRFETVTGKGYRPRTIALRSRRPRRGAHARGRLHRRRRGAAGDRRC